MPPKKAAEPPPEPPPEEEEQGPVISPKIAKFFGPDPDPEGTDLKERSANLDDDERLKALQAQQRSANEDTTPSTSASQQLPADSDDLRSEGIKTQERMLKRIVDQGRSGRSAGNFSSGRPIYSPGLAGSQKVGLSRSHSDGNLIRKNSTPTSSMFRDGMDPQHALNNDVSKSLGRLLQDIPLAGVSDSAHSLRCGAVDRMHELFIGQKSAAKLLPKPSPNYLAFSKDERVMVGSLRVEPHERHYQPLGDARPSQKPAWMCKPIPKDSF